VGEQRGDGQHGDVRAGTDGVGTCARGRRAAVRVGAGRWRRRAGAERRRGRALSRAGAQGQAAAAARWAEERTAASGEKERRETREKKGPTVLKGLFSVARDGHRK
jgi:hypothetical protein